MGNIKPPNQESKSKCPFEDDTQQKEDVFWICFQICSTAVQVARHPESLLLVFTGICSTTVQVARQPESLLLPSFFPKSSLVKARREKPAVPLSSSSYLLYIVPLGFKYDPSINGRKPV